MAIELVVPEAGESITEVQIGHWLKQPGDRVEKDEPLVEIETDKVTLELPAPVAGTITKVLKQTGDVATVGEVIGEMGEGDEAVAEPTPVPEPAAQEPAPQGAADAPAIMPAAQRLLAEHGLDASLITGTGPGGRLLKEDVERHLSTAQTPARPAPKAEAPPAPAPKPQPAAKESDATRAEDRVPMTPMRRRIAERLVTAQQTAAMLTTFNEIDMSAVMALRKQHQEQFTGDHGVKLGFMSFFVKASVDALKRYPAINARIEENDIIYRNYYDIGIAVSGPKGLVVPVLRNAERLSFAGVEQKIGDFAKRARDNKLELDELAGGTFTITNGGVFGSLLSTPILNPPQSGILGLHAINERPVALNGQVVIRPMMYVALTYDHRVVDGREAVSCLKRIKEVTENPTRMLLEV